MNQEFPKIKPMGERAILVQFEPEISEVMLQKVLFYKDKTEVFYDEVKVEVINTYNSLLINYESYIEDVYGEVSALEKLFKNANIAETAEARLFKLPVCYSSKLGPDMELISSEKKMEPEEIIRLHSEAIYTVYFAGFLPGFLYLGGLDEKLHFPRKNEPRLKIEKGAVGIGGKQTGIYPKSSPGGWQIIGNCPVPVFVKNKLPPIEISAGDKIKFYPVSEAEFEKISEEINTGKFNLKAEKYDG
ncbi:5-oxoprolinase subunit PxpB [Zunongwangia sp. F363]|uniref:5-oxoprolinase subunit PxpB n=1 Tax=Autumnicola tepida TaxID=3075595 RepID=A0ABU3CDB5_9FLAO|nr:5-oxoprolinase subunit PxpB [Zunongwangia sp. F363]MDT0644332.1 5-oxoprolinase subunit PxpB [Zunongwangia sp. F363]